MVARTAGETATEYVFDQQGNVADRTDTSGTIQSITQYDGWGNEQAISGTPTDPSGYNAQSGYYLDRETGLYLCQHRFYDPANGRWLNRDPIGYSGGTNLYGYCAGAPVGPTDSSGEIVVFVLAGLAVLALGKLAAAGYVAWAEAKSNRDQQQATADYVNWMRNHHPESDDADCNDAPQRDSTQGTLGAAGDAWGVGQSATYDNPFVVPSGSNAIPEGPNAAIVTAGDDASKAIDSIQQTVKAASDMNDEWREKKKKAKEKEREKQGGGEAGKMIGDPVAFH